MASGLEMESKPRANEPHVVDDEKKTRNKEDQGRLGVPDRHNLEFASVASWRGVDGIISLRVSTSILKAGTKMIVIPVGWKWNPSHMRVWVAWLTCGADIYVDEDKIKSR